MRGPASATLVACLLMYAGCRQSPHVAAHIELMNAQRRALEDQLYELKYQHEGTVDQIDDLEQENADLRQRLGLPQSRPAGRSLPQIEGASDMPEFSPPVIDEGEPVMPDIVIPPELNPGDPATPSSSSTQQVPSAVALTRSALQDPEIATVEIDDRGTRGVDLDLTPGDDGIEVMIAPRNAAGELIALPAPVTIVLLDYALREQGPAARFARWDLSAVEVQRFLEDSPPGQGIRLQLLWPDQPPRHPRLRLDVRYETLDGRLLEARQDVTVHLYPRLAQRWTPRSEAGERPTGRSGTRNAAAPPSSPRPQPLARPLWKPYR